MSDGKITVSGVGGRYARALFELARDDKSLEVVEGDLDGLDNMLATSADLNRMINSPALARSDQLKAMGAIGEKAGFSSLTVKFLGLVTMNGRLHALGRMSTDFKTLLRDHRGEITAEVSSAHDLIGKQLDDLKAQLKAAMGQDVKIDLDIDPDLIGGLVVKVGSRMIDSSLRTKLDNLHLAMKEAR